MSRPTTRNLGRDVEAVLTAALILAVALSLGGAR